MRANVSKDGCEAHRDRHENIGGRPDRDRALRGPPASSGHQGGAVHRRDPRARAADIATLKALRGKGQAARAPAGAMR